MSAVTTLTLANGSPLKVVEPELAVGGEGTVYMCDEPAGSVLKQYLPDVLGKHGTTLAPKLQAMVDNQPIDPTAAQGHVSLAWPRILVLDDTGHFAGYIMPAIDMKASVELHMVSNPSDRRRSVKAPPWLAGFTWEYLLRTAQNLASATHALHEAGYVVGDFNERNVLVHMNALVTLVDCDSMQVPGPSGTPFLCEVFRPEFTAPELLHANLSSVVREPASDRFSLAVHVYQLLMEGRHPFAGTWSGAGDKPERYELAEQGLFVQNGDKRLAPQAGTPPFAIFTDDVRELFDRAFVAGATKPAARPTGLEWHGALHTLAGTLVSCATDPSHRYPGHLSECPWCKLGQGPQTVMGAPVQAALAPAVAPVGTRPQPAPMWTRPPPAPPPWQRLMQPLTGSANPTAGQVAGSLFLNPPALRLAKRVFASAKQPRSGHAAPAPAPARAKLGWKVWTLIVVGALFLLAAASPSSTSRGSDLVLGVVALAGATALTRRKRKAASGSGPLSQSPGRGLGLYWPFRRRP